VEGNELGLSKLAVKRPVATGAILLLIMLIGLVSLYQSPLDLLPEIEVPVLAIITPFPGSSPQETLELVTKPIEDGVSAIGGLTGINSFSQENMSLVVLQLDWGADVKRLREDVSVRMDLISFPDGVQRPILLEFDPTLMPIMQVSASGAEDPVRLTEWLEGTASPRIDSISGVASVQIQGGAKQDLFIRTSPETMSEYEVSFEQISNVLRASLMDLPAGIIDLEDRQVRIRFLGRYAESDLLSGLVVGFKVDQEELEKLIGGEIDINLNQLLANQGTLFSGGGSAGGVPVREVYLDDIFDFERGTISGGSINIPLDDQWAAENGEDIESRLFILTANPNVNYNSDYRRMELSLTSLGRAPVVPESGLGRDGVTRIEDIWIIDQAVWDNGMAIIPLNPISIEQRNITAGEIASLAEIYPLIIRATGSHLLLAFHEDWENIRGRPILSVPDYGAWLSNVQQDVGRGLDDASRSLEDGLTELAISMVLGSMAPGGSSFPGLDFDGDFPIIPVSLGMIAEIEQDTYNPTTITRYNRQPSIGLTIQKEGDANTVLVARQVRAALEELSEDSRDGFSTVQFSTVFDQAEEIERALADLARSLAGGALLAVLVLILFLRNWRTTMFIGLSIPAAIIASFTLLYFADLTINLMTLGGLALAAGMLVDNAIVVSENIYRRYQIGEEPADAAINGSQEVAGAITASTLTTISVFFPVVFLSGLAGQLFWEFALTVTCAILASLLVALTVIPLLASRSLRLRSGEKVRNVKPHRLPGYRKFLALAVDRPWWVLIFALFFIAAGAFGYSTLGTELFPSPDESSFTIDVTLPPGSTLSVTDSYVTEIESILSDVDEVVSFSTNIGGSGFMGVPAESGLSNQAGIRVEIDPGSLGEIDRIIEAVREDVARIPGEAETTFARESLLDSAGFEARLDLVITGEDLEEVKNITGQAMAVLAAQPYLTDVQSSLEESRPEIHIRLDHSQALQKGVTLVQVATAVRQALEGVPVSRIETEAGLLNIVLGYQRAEINTIEDIGRIGFYTPAGEYLYLDQVAELTEDFGPQSIPREDRQIVGQIQAQYAGLDLGAATDRALEALGVLDLPSGYEIKTAGSFNLMGDVMSELQLVLILAALLVYLVMAAQFESLLHPFVIICSLPLAYTGAVIALMVTGNNVSIPAMIGVVVLSGILVNDGIIMVDFINQQRRFHGLGLREAIIEGAAARLRPILMTTATTVLGLLPLALGFGEGSQLQAPMAITIIGGQVTGTFLLLLAIPSIYKVVTRDHLTGEEPVAALVSGQTVSPAAAGGGSGSRLHSDTTRTAAASGAGKGKSLIKPLLRMILVLILAAVILILLGVSGQDFLTVIR
jgi:hydrophobic/amphiphilic exporter-1 (mainly G- bacteria), HAE1 family